MKQIAASKLTWVFMAGILVVVLFIGAVGDSGPRSNAERGRDLAATIKCPTCRSQSAADSDAAAARAIRTEIARRIDGGESNEEIRAYFADRYGEEVLLTPSGSGLTGLVWGLPVAALVASMIGLGLVLRRWQSRAPLEATAADRTLVDAYVADHSPAGRDDPDGGGP
ncbi:MAG TPA: cytochrome c-type biogenesis protein CcmH [Acidimicrobiales bacterium]|nr:cytochrome c-type biogenesis protein CcmH [Acidimicrobiales bacterium]